MIHDVIVYFFPLTVQINKCCFEEKHKQYPGPVGKRKLELEKAREVLGSSTCMSGIVIWKRQPKQLLKQT